MDGSTDDASTWAAFHLVQRINALVVYNDGVCPRLFVTFALIRVVALFFSSNGMFALVWLIVCSQQLPSILSLLQTWQTGHGLGINPIPLCPPIERIGKTEQYRFPREFFALALVPPSPLSDPSFTPCRLTFGR